MKLPSLSYQIDGNGQNIVLLHGFLESPNMWKSFINHINGALRTINIQIPNHNPNGELVYLNSLSQQADLIHQTLSKLQVDNPIFIGHSLGGYLALAYAEKYSEQMAGLVLVNSTCFADNEERKEQRTRAIQLVEKHPEALVQMAIKNLFPKASLERHKIEINKLISDAKKLPIPGIQSCLMSMRDRKDRTEVLRHFDKNKLFIYGKDDPLIPIESSKNAIRKSKCPSIGLSAGHMAWLEDKDTLQKVLLEFIRQTL